VGILRALAVGARSRARFTIVVALVGYFLLLLTLGGHSEWARLGVRPLSVSFGDLRGVTSGWECVRKGFDVRRSNPCDPWNRPLVYPSVWMAPAFLGIGQGATVGLGVGLAIVFFLTALWLVPRTARIPDALAYALVLCSPAVMLGVERGNVDLAMFVLLMGAALAFRRRLGSVVASVLVVLATILKLYPVFAAPLLLRQRRRAALVSFGLVLGAFAAYVLSVQDDVRSARLGAFPTGGPAFGAIRSAEALTPLLRKAHVETTPHALFVPLVVLAVAAAVGIGWRLAPRLAGTAGHDDRLLDLFWAGASVYVVLFAVFRTYDYRMVFLLATLPQLLVWARRRIAVAWVTLAAVVVSVWLEPVAWKRVPGIHHALASWDHDPAQMGPAAFAQLLLFVGLLAALVATAPAWLGALAEPAVQRLKGFRQRSSGRTLPAATEGVRRPGARS
jgi:hypothetical protein